jgi:hypothetical protein
MAKTVAKKTDKKQGNNKVGPCNPPKPHRFKPGQSGNPNGRPKSKPITAAIKKLLDKNDGAALLAIAAASIEKASEGDHRHLKEILDRVEGKVLDKVEHSGNIHSVSTEDYKDMTDERKAQFLRTAGITDVLAPGDGEDPGEMGPC